MSQRLACRQYGFAYSWSIQGIANKLRSPRSACVFVLIINGDPSCALYRFLQLLSSRSACPQRPAHLRRRSSSRNSKQINHSRNQYTGVTTAIGVRATAAAIAGAGVTSAQTVGAGARDASTVASQFTAAELRIARLRKCAATPRRRRAISKFAYSSAAAGSRAGS